jgi:hypothetical protein
MRVAVGLSVLGLILAVGTHQASAQQPPAACTPATDDTLRPLPAPLADQARRALNLHSISPTQLGSSVVVRCMDGHVLACSFGANLPCGKANIAQTLPQGEAWCRQRPNANFIPAYITGHDSAYQWHCVNGAPQTIGAPAPLDARGFFQKYWKSLG